MAKIHLVHQKYPQQTQCGRPIDGKIKVLSSAEGVTCESCLQWVKYWDRRKRVEERVKAQVRQDKS